MGLLVPNFHMGDKPVGIRNAYLREWGDFLLGRPWNPRHIPDSSLSCWGRLFVKWENGGPSQPFGFCLLHLWALPVLPAPKIPPPNQVQISSTCAHRVWPRRPCDQLRVMLFLWFSKRPYLLLPVPKYCLRVLTTFSPTYSFWMKWKLILSGLVRSCVIFPHPIIKALQGGVRRDSQATTPPSRCRRG